MAVSSLPSSNQPFDGSCSSRRVYKRRKHFRHTIYNDITVSIHFPDGYSQVANLLDLSILGAYAIVFSKMSLHPLVDQRVSIEFISRVSDLSYSCLGTIRHVTQENLIDFDSFGIGLAFENELPQNLIDCYI